MKHLENNTNVVFESKEAIIVDETDTKPNDSDKLNPELASSLNNATTATTESNNNENKVSNEIKNEDVDFLQVCFLYYLYKMLINLSPARLGKSRGGKSYH